MHIDCPFSTTNGFVMLEKKTLWRSPIPAYLAGFGISPDKPLLVKTMVEQYLESPVFVMRFSSHVHFHHLRYPAGLFC